MAGRTELYLPVHLGQYPDVLDHHLKGRQQNMELANIRFAQVRYGRLRCERFLEVELVLKDRIACFRTTMVDDTVHLGCPRLYFALPLTDERQWGYNEERAIYSGRRHAAQLVQEAG